MPTYEYLCQTCSHRFEKWQKMTDESLTTCPECGGYIRRVFYPAGIVFKGSGFYKTDYAKGSGVPPNGETKKSETSTETKTGSESQAADSSPSTNNPSSNGSSASSSSSGDSKATTPAGTK